jgi:putative tryptophan/tyrosine transport system substrate-binding protein
MDQVPRRRFLISAGVLLAVPLAAEAQPAGTAHRMAIVHPALRAANLTEAGHPYYKEFFSELRRLGYVEGQNLVVERRSAEGRAARYPELVQEVVRLQPDLVFAVSSRLVLALKAATTTIPIVGLTADPIAGGIVSSLARPGGNVTGFSVTTADENLGKQLALLHEGVPTVSRVAFLVPQRMWEGPEDRYGRVMSEAASRLGLTLVGAALRDPIQEPEYRRVFAEIVRDRVEALVVGDPPENLAHRQVIVELAARARLPAMYPYRDFVHAGGLMAYAVDVAQIYRGVAGYIDRIFKGTPPGELPYQLPTKFELIINLQTAKTLGLTIPRLVLLRADRVIE